MCSSYSMNCKKGWKGEFIKLTFHITIHVQLESHRFFREKNAVRSFCNNRTSKKSNILVKLPWLWLLFGLALSQ